MVVGCAGASLDVAAWLDVPWRVYGDYEFGYLRVITTAKDLTTQYIRNSDGSVIDELTLPVRF